MIRPLSMGPAFDQFAVSIDYDGLGLTVARFPTPMEAARALVWLRAVQERVGGWPEWLRPAGGGVLKVCHEYSEAPCEPYDYGRTEGHRWLTALCESVEADTGIPTWWDSINCAESHVFIETPWSGPVGMSGGAQ